MARLSAALVAVFLCLTPAAHAAECAPGDEMLAALQEQHGEVPAHRGVLNNGNLMIVVANPESGSFTILVIPPEAGGVVCIVAAGYALASITPAPKPKGTSM